MLWIPSAAPTLEDARWLAARYADRVWIAVEQLLEGDGRDKLAALQALAAASGLPLVAAGDVHMHVRERRMLQDTLTAIRLGTTVQSAGFALYPNGERYLRPRARLARLYPAALLGETLRVIEGCDFSLRTLRYEYPEELVPAARRRRAGCVSSRCKVCAGAGRTAWPIASGDCW